MTCTSTHSLRARPGGIRTFSSFRSRPAIRLRASARDGSCRPATSRKRCVSRAPISRIRARRARGRRRRAPCPAARVAAVPGRSEYGKHVEVRQRRALEIRRELLEVLVGLAGKSDDDVGADRRVRHPRADVVDERRVVLDRVRPPHRRQHAVARVLQRQVEVRREAIATPRRDRRSRACSPSARAS